MEGQVNDVDEDLQSVISRSYPIDWKLMEIKFDERFKCWRRKICRLVTVAVSHFTDRYQETDSKQPFYSLFSEGRFIALSFFAVCA